MQTTEIRQLTMEELEAGLPHIRRSPQDNGVLEMIVRRPRTNEREVLEEGRLDPQEGLVGDNWRKKGSSRTKDGSAHRDLQLTLMNARVIALVAQDKERWPLAGDQLYVDLNLSKDNLPAGTRLAIGDAVVEVTDKPHTGCKKFMARYGLDALTFVNSKVGKQLQMRGINARVVRPGAIRRGDRVRKL
ncbi:MAG: MOSC domain-containing protein [bacterium]